MVRIILMILLSSFAFANLQYLTKSLESETAFENVNNNFVRDTTTTNSDDDAVDENVAIGFSFPFNGSTYTHLNIDTNGHISFTDMRSEYTNRQLARANRPHSIYPYWDDMNPQRGGRIKYGTIGSGITQHFVIHWDSVPHYPRVGRYAFQLVLYKNGNIRFRYDDTSNTDGSSATIGVQESVDNFDEHIFNTVNRFDASQDILYSIATAELNLTKESCVISDPINKTVNPKRITAATIRYALEVQNSGTQAAQNVILTDTLSSFFISSTIRNLQV